MILCPNCHHSEIAGSLFCSECGAQLITTGNLTTHAFNSTAPDIIQAPAESMPSASGTSTIGIESEGISLHLLESGEVMYLSGRMEFSVGRATDGQPILPDVDLSPFDAYAQGVSRLHATIKIVDHGVVITDLGSSNGTRVNGQKIVPHIDYPLNHGDVMALGKFKIQILLNKKPKNIF
jgi:pSer/pThr/pTyr-binding forkhead associated (FHA) protein